MQSKAIIGICKNAGKTTVLNYHLANYEGIYALTSIGLDGESRDQVFNNEKPKIFVKKGTVIATGINSLKKSDVTYEVLNITNIMTPLGYIALVEALSAGYIELSGTSHVTHLEYIYNWIKNNTRCSVLYIDGALSRKQFSSIDFIDTVDIVIGASFINNMSKTLDEAMLWKEIYSIEKCEIDNIEENVVIDDKQIHTNFLDIDFLKSELNKETENIYLNCIVTSEVFNYILMQSKNREIRLVIENPNKLFINLDDFKKLKNSKLDLYVRNPIKISQIFINPIGYGYKYDKIEFKKGVENIFNCEIINVGEVKWK
ncbi:MAG: hypothetical protein ACK5NF_07715 [Bacilli bacterium]